MDVEEAIEIDDLHWSETYVPRPALQAKLNEINGVGVSGAV